MFEAICCISITPIGWEIPNLSIRVKWHHLTTGDAQEMWKVVMKKYTWLRWKQNGMQKEETITWHENLKSPDIWEFWVHMWLWRRNRKPARCQAERPRRGGARRGSVRPWEDQNRLSGMTENGQRKLWRSCRKQTALKHWSKEVIALNSDS